DSLSQGSRQTGLHCAHRTSTVSSRIFFLESTISSGMARPRLRLRASNEHLLSVRVARAMRRAWPPRALSLALNRNVEGITLPVDQQQGKIGWFNWVGQSLKHDEVRDRLSIEFEDDVAWLETGGFGQAAFFNVGHHHPAVHSQVHLPSQGRGHIVEDDAGERMSRGSRDRSGLALFGPFTRRLLDNQFSLVRLTLAHEFESVFTPNRRRSHEVSKMSAVHHVAPVKSDNHITALESGFLSGPFRLHIGHDRPFHIGKTKDLA